MEILKEGDINRARWIGKCSICNTIIECMGNEIKELYSSQNQQYGLIDCPFCCCSLSIGVFNLLNIKAQEILKEIKENG